MNANKDKLDRIAAIVAEPAQPAKTCLSVAVRLLGELIEHKPVGAEIGAVETVMVNLADNVHEAQSVRGMCDRDWVKLLGSLAGGLPAGGYKARGMVLIAWSEMTAIYAAGVYNRAVNTKQKETAE